MSYVIWIGHCPGISTNVVIIQSKSGLVSPAVGSKSSQIVPGFTNISSKSFCKIRIIVFIVN